MLSSKNRRGSRMTLLIACVFVVQAFAGCGVKGGDVEDAAGMNLNEVRSLSMEAQYESYRERYLQVQTLMRDTQLVVSDGVWRWAGEASVPRAGSVAPRPLAEATGANSYFLAMTRLIDLPDDQGQYLDVEKMTEYFRAQGWEVKTRVHGTELPIVTADVDDGYVIEYAVQPTGSRSLQVSSYVFWGSVPELTAAIIDRLGSEPIPSESVPGVYEALPKWDE